MRKVALTMSVAVDGCVGGSHGAVDWPVKTALERFDRGVTARYPQAHGCLLPCRCGVRGRERYTRVRMDASLTGPMVFLRSSRFEGKRRALQSY